MFGKNTRLSLTQLVKFPKYIITDPTPDIIQIVIKRTKEKSEIRNQYKDRGKVFPQYTIGMNVLVKEHRLSSAEDHETHKLFLLYHGPYQICEVHKNNTVTVQDSLGRRRSYNYKNVKQYHEGNPPTLVKVTAEQQ